MTHYTRHAVIYIVVLITTLLDALPDLNKLRPIHYISQSSTVSIIERYRNLEDISFYGRPPHMEEEAPNFLNENMQWDNESSTIKNEKDLYVALLHNTFVSPQHLGTMFNDQEQFLFDLHVSPGNPIFWPINTPLHAFNTVHCDTLVTVQGPSYFYHWVIDRLPSIFLLRDLLQSKQNIKLLINTEKEIPGYVFEYLDLLGISKERLVTPAKNTLYRANKLYFATPFLMEPIPRNLLLQMRQQLLAAAQTRPTSRSYKNNLIVVIQRKEADRKIYNLEAVVDSLKTFFPEPDFEIIIFDGSQQVSEQIILFNNAQVIVGVLASGLTNVLYANPHAHVIEIRPSWHGLQGAEWCWWLSCAVDAHYWAIPTPFQLSDTFVTCPIKQLEKILKRIKSYS